MTEHNDLVEGIARDIARARTHGAVYMGGEHNPLPSEHLMAQQFVERIRAAEKAKLFAVIEAGEKDLCYEAWVVIANVSGGNWEKQPEKWQVAAARWRDRYHESLEAGPMLYEHHRAWVSGEDHVGEADEDD